LQRNTFPLPHHLHRNVRVPDVKLPTHAQEAGTGILDEQWSTSSGTTQYQHPEAGGCISGHAAQQTTMIMQHQHQQHQHQQYQQPPLLL
jgi:hypothetical protein